MKAEWKITGRAGLPALRIEAESFDEALAIARKTDHLYDTGQIIGKSADAGKEVNT